MARKYLHPEKLFGIGCTPLDKVINHLSNIGTKLTETEVDKVMKMLTKRDMNFLLKVIERDKGTHQDVANEDFFKECVTYSMKVAQDIVETHTKTNLPIYSIGKDFFRVVKSLHRDIPVKNILLDNKFLYLKFNSEKYEGAYVASYKISDEIDGLEMTGIRISFTLKKYDVTGMVTLVFMIVGDKLNVSNIKLIKTTKELKGHSESVLIYPNDDIEQDIDIIMGVINSVIYIKSRDPEIEFLRPLRKYTKKELNKLEESKRAELCYFPLKLLNWSYYGRAYSVDETNVIPHLRWQPCGSGRKDVKLIWVKEHVRHYNKETKE